jgi:hypothetical protein
LKTTPEECNDEMSLAMTVFLRRPKKKKAICVVRLPEIAMECSCTGTSLADDRHTINFIGPTMTSREKSNKKLQKQTLLCE